MEDDSRDLFDQMDAIIHEKLSEEVDMAADDILSEYEDAKLERLVFEAFTLKQPIYKSLYDLLYGEPHRDVDVFLQDLQAQVDVGTLSDPDYYLNQNIIAVLSSTRSITSSALLGEAYVPKSEIQIAILVEEYLFPEQKTTLLELTDQFLSGTGINLEDPNSVTDALMQHEKRIQEFDNQQVSLAKIKMLFHEEFKKYTVNSNDPAYKQILAAGARHVLKEGEIPFSLHMSFIAENLRLLGITQESYVQSLAGITAKFKQEPN